MTYTITQSDTMSNVAQRFGVPLNELLAVNNLNPNSVIFPGMIIIIPSRPQQPPRPIPPRPPFPPQPPRPIPPRPPITPVPPIGNLPPKNRIYIVRRGDTIWSIARMFGVSVQNIMFVNGLRAPVVFPGQRLIIPFRPFHRDEEIIVEEND